MIRSGVCSLFLVVMLLFGACAHAKDCDQTLAPIEIMTQFGPIAITEASAQELYRDQLEIAEALKLKGPERKEALKKYFEQRPRTRMQVAATFANYAMAMVIAAQLSLGFHETPDAMARWLLAMPATLLVTDFFSALLHKWLDSYASEKNRFWGSAARAFRIHHEFPGNMNDLGPLSNIASFGKLLAPLYLAGVVSAPQMSPDVGASALTMLLFFSHGTEIHRQSHLSRPSAWIRKLQDWRVLLNRKDHMAHHRAPTDTAYGIVNGWSNPFTAHLWTKLDLIFWKTLRKMPHNWVQHPTAIPDSVILELRDDLASVPQALLVSLSEPEHANESLNELLRLWIENNQDQEAVP